MYFQGQYIVKKSLEIYEGSNRKVSTILKSVYANLSPSAFPVLKDE